MLSACHCYEFHLLDSRRNTLLERGTNTRNAVEVRCRPWPHAKVANKGFACVETVGIRETVQKEPAPELQQEAQEQGAPEVVGSDSDSSSTSSESVEEDPAKISEAPTGRMIQKGPIERTLQSDWPGMLNGFSLGLISYHLTRQHADLQEIAVARSPGAHT